MKPRRVGGLAFIRAIAANAIGEIKEMYVRKVAHRTSIYAVRIEPREEYEREALERGWYFRGVSRFYELLLAAENVKLEGWEKIEIVTRKMRHQDYGMEWEFKIIRYKGKEVPLGRIPEGYEPIEER